MESAGSTIVCDLRLDPRFTSTTQASRQKAKQTIIACAEGLEAGGASSGNNIAGPDSARSAIQPQDQAHKEQVPAHIPHNHVEARESREPGAASAQGDTDVDRSEAQPRPAVAAKARADRWAQYEEPGSSGAAAAAQPIHTRPESSTFLQVLDCLHPPSSCMARIERITTLCGVWQDVKFAVFNGSEWWFFILSFRQGACMCRHFAARHKQHMCTGSCWHWSSPS